MEFAPLNGQKLPPLGDNADLQSQFGYAVRVAVFNLNPPPDASSGASSDWQEARRAMQTYLTKILAK